MPWPMAMYFRVRFEEVLGGRWCLVGLLVLVLMFSDEV